MGYYPISQYPADIKEQRARLLLYAHSSAATGIYLEWVSTAIGSKRLCLNLLMVLVYISLMNI